MSCGPPSRAVANGVGGTVKLKSQWRTPENRVACARGCSERQSQANRTYTICRQMSRHILILVENLSVPFDRRVWQESRALVNAGFRVTVICPTGLNQDQEPEDVIEGVRILRYPLRPAAGGPAGYIREYGVALWRTLSLAIKVRREGRVDAVQACNPPDLLFLIALALRPWGARFVFRSP